MQQLTRVFFMKHETQETSKIVKWVLLSNLPSLTYFTNSQGHQIIHSTLSSNFYKRTNTIFENVLKPFYVYPFSFICVFSRLSMIENLDVRLQKHNHTQHTKHLLSHLNHIHLCVKHTKTKHYEK